MQYTTLPRTDLKVSRIAMGCWALAGDMTWGPQDEADAVAGIRSALDVGINFFDTAEMYGGGISERVVGKALSGVRDQAIIATKFNPENSSAADVTADSVACNVQPRGAGQLLVGSSRQLGDETGAVDAGILGRMVNRALEHVPALAQLSVLRTWTGFRAATPDKLPLIGPCPGYRRVYLAAGHEGLGITMALGTAELLVDQVVRRESKIPQEPYLPSRFDANEASNP